MQYICNVIEWCSWNCDNDVRCHDTGYQYIDMHHKLQMVTLRLSVGGQLMHRVQYAE